MPLTLLMRASHLILSRPWSGLMIQLFFFFLLIKGEADPLIHLSVIISSELMQVRRVYPLNRAIPVAILLPSILDRNKDTFAAGRCIDASCRVEAGGRIAEIWCWWRCLRQAPSCRNRGEHCGSNPKRSMRGWIKLKA